MWCIPKVDEVFIQKMHDVLEVYGREYNPLRPVVCFDEKTLQMLSTPRGEKEVKPGKSKRTDYEYKREGTANIFVSIEPKAGKRYLEVTKNHTSKVFAAFLKHLIFVEYQTAEKVVLVSDNLNIHHMKYLKNIYKEDVWKLMNEKIEWHYTPVHASWLNMAEIEIGILTKSVLAKRISTSRLLKSAVRSFQKRRNESKSKINWQFTKEKADKVFKITEN